MKIENMANFTNLASYTLILKETAEHLEKKCRVNLLSQFYRHFSLFLAEFYALIFNLDFLY